MDVHTFVSDLLQALTDTALCDQIALHTEGPTAEGKAYLQGNPTVFLRFYFNSRTGTLAFALIKEEQRIWGIDFDNRRGWHLHPLESPAKHEAIMPMTVREIVMALRDVGGGLIVHNVRPYAGEEEHGVGAVGQMEGNGRLTHYSTSSREQ